MDSDLVPTTSPAISTPTTKSPTISAVIVSHQVPFTDILKEMANQTHQPDQIILVGCCLDISGYDIDIKILLNHRDDWGHEARDTGLKLATEDYVMFVNSDDLYDPSFIKKLLEHKVDLAYCDFDERGAYVIKSQPVLGSITSGNFIIKREIAQKVGWNHRDYEGDGKFINDIIGHVKTHENHPEILFYHR